MPLDKRAYFIGSQSERYVVDCIRNEFPLIRIEAGIDLPSEVREDEWEKVHGYFRDLFIEGKSVDVKTFSKQQNGTFISRYELMASPDQHPDYIFIWNNVGTKTTKAIDVVPWKVVLDYCLQIYAGKGKWFELERHDGTKSEGIYFKNCFEAFPKFQKKNSAFGIRAAMTFAEFVRKELLDVQADKRRSV